MGSVLTCLVCRFPTTTLPKAHWLRQKKGKKYRLFELNGSTVCAFTGWLQPVDETTFKVIYVKKGKKEFDTDIFDKSGTKGTMLFDAIEGCYVGMECKDVELEVEKTKNPNWYKVKKTGQYVLKRDCTAIKKKVSDTVKVNKIDDTSVQNVDILIKAGEVVGVPSKFAFEKQSHYNAMHLEVFTDDEGVSKFIDNKEDKGRTTYEVPADKSLTLAAPCDFLNANTKVKIYQQGDNYTQIGFESIENIVLPVKGNIYTSNKDNEKGDGEKGYETAPKGYHIYNFKVVNEHFSNALEEGVSSILWMSSGGTKDNPTRTVKYIHPKAGQKFWVPNDKVSGTEGTWVALSKPITSYYDKDPKDTDKGIKIEEPTPIRKIETFEDSTNKTKWWKVQGKGKEKDKIGWIKYDDLTKKNPYQWETLGWKLKEDTGTQYFYQFGDYVNESEPHQFINDIWELVDTDKDKVLSVRELQRCMSDEVKIAKLSKLICKHRSEWNMSQDFDTFKQEIEAIYAKGIEQEEEEGQRQDLETARDEKIALLKEKIEKLSFWDKIQDGPVTKKTTDTSKEEEPSRFSIMQETTALKQAQRKKQKEAEVPKRTFPVSNDNVYHFHPIAFVEHMKLIVGGRAPWMEIALEQALKYKGLDEDTGKLAKAVQEDYHTYTGHPKATGSTSWCASFASWCLGQLELKNPKSWSSQRFLNHSSLKKSELQYGAIVVFTDCYKNGEIIYDDNDNSFGHVTFAVGQLDNGKYACLGGNQGDMIKVSDYDCSGNVFAKNRKKTKWRKMTGVYVPKSYSKNSNDEFTDKDQYKTIDEANKKIIKTELKTKDYEGT